MPPSVRDPGLQTLVDAAAGRGDLPALALAVLDGDADTVAWAGAGAATGPELRVRLASVTKAVMALVTHRLTADGVVALDEAIGDGACLADLLSHTAGLPMELPGVDWLAAPPADTAALHALLDRYAQPSGPSPFRYSNTGYWLLDSRLTHATGSTTEALIGETLAPLEGCAAIGFAAPDLGGHVVTPAGRTVRSVTRYHAPRRPSGGLTGDLPSVAWLGRALVQSVRTTPALAQERAPIAEGWGWSAGLERWTTAGRPLFGHHGSWGGTRTLLVVDPADGRAAVAAVTSDAGGPVLAGLLAAIGLPPPRPRRACAAAARELPRGLHADGAGTAELRADPAGGGDLLLVHPPATASARVRRLGPGLGVVVDGAHAGQAVTTTPDGDVLRVGVRSFTPVPGAPG